jgi:SWI/SNF-related matrix-associated actin-dependent regulator 1 of chromatin subfamily A
MHIITATLPTPDSPHVELRAPTASPTALTFLFGAEYNFRRKCFQVPRELWTAVQATIPPDAWSLEESSEVANFVTSEALETDVLRQAANRRMVSFDAILQSRGLNLREYQKAGILWLASRHSGLLTDEMGLGKTVQFLCAVPEDSGSMVVCPASLRGYWRDELSRWRPDLRPIILQGKHAFQLPLTNECVILSDASLLPEDAIRQFSRHADFGIFLGADEAHAYKGDSLRTRSLTALCTRIRSEQGTTIGLTGTPLLNHPEELYTLARTFGCHRLGWGSLPAFKRAFEVEETRWGKTYGTPKPAAREGLRRISLRRTREEVLPELPAKTVRYIPVELTKALTAKLDALSASLNLDAWEWEGLMPDFTHYSEVRVQIAERKIKAAVQWIESMEHAGEPAIVFSAHRAPIDVIGDRDGWDTITGDTPPMWRTDSAKRFQDGELLGIAGTIGAMGTGFTLTRACHMLFVDETFTPGLNAQARDRFHRLGQTRPVTVSILLGDHPLERRVQAILEKKTALAEEALR